MQFGVLGMIEQRSELLDLLDQHWWDFRAADLAASLHRQKDWSEGPDLLVKLEQLRDSYISELRELSDDGLWAAAHEALLERELARPFHQSGTDADYGHFGRCAFLTIVEAVALSLGKDPRIVSWEMVHPHLGESVFASEYANRLDLVERAVIWRELPELFSPLDFLTWAHRYKLAVPSEFIENVFARGEPIKYWHDHCLELTHLLEQVQAELEHTRSERDEAEMNCDELIQRSFDEWLEAQEEIERIQHELNVKNSELQTGLSNLGAGDHLVLQDIDPENEQKPLQPKQRATMLRLIIGMAIDGYAYEPRAVRSSVPREIAEGIARFGLSITGETVRSYLNDGREYVDDALLEQERRQSKQ